MGGVCEGSGIPPTDHEAQLCRQEFQSETQVADAQTCSFLVSHILCCGFVGGKGKGRVAGRLG